MKQLLILPLVAGVLVTGCAPKPGAEKNLAIDPSNMDTTVACGEDFYEYACGGWIKKNPLKPEYARYGSFDVLAENNQKDVYKRQTLPAPITLFCPIMTPGKMIEPPPIHTPSSIFTGKAYVRQISSLSDHSCTMRSFILIECVAVYICTLGAIKTLLPISIRLLSTKVQFILIITLSPTKMCFPYSQ